MKPVKLAVAVAAALCVGASMAASPSLTLGNYGTVGLGMGSVSGATFGDTWTFNLGTYGGEPPL